MRLVERTARRPAMVPHPEATVAAPPHPDHALLAWLRAGDETAFGDRAPREPQPSGRRASHPAVKEARENLTNSPRVPRARAVPDRTAEARGTGSRRGARPDVGQRNVQH
jgi:hypothetical protein